MLKFFQGNYNLYIQELTRIIFKTLKSCHETKDFNYIKLANEYGANKFHVRNVFNVLEIFGVSILVHKACMINQIFKAQI